MKKGLRIALSIFSLSVLASPSFAIQSSNASASWAWCEVVETSNGSYWCCTDGNGRWTCAKI